MSDTELRAKEKAKEIVKDSQPHITHYEIPEDCIPYLINRIHEALEAAYKQGTIAERMRVRAALPKNIKEFPGFHSKDFSSNAVFWVAEFYNWLIRDRILAADCEESK